MDRRKLTLVLSVITILLVSSTAVVLFLGMPEDDSINFYVFGDSQGYQGGVEQIVTAANLHRPEFIFHCGDLTPFGQENQYQDIKTVLDQSIVPVYTTIGNHDIKDSGGELYEEYFGSSTYSFDLGPAHFTVFNTSASDITSQEFTWLEQDLLQTEAEFKFVFTHIPPFDPRTGEDHSLINSTTSTHLMSLFEEHEVDVVFTGHIHMYNETIVNGVKYVITGGAGASLYADEDSGGIYHYMNVMLDDTGLSIEPVLLNNPSLPRNMIAVRGLTEDVTLSLDDLLQMNEVSGLSSFQNQYDNWRGYGTYIGVEISELVELVGGMTTDEKLVVKSFDGYLQEFSYSNVYPNTTWAEIQGPMILAYTYNETQVLEWADGMRIVMLPPDNAYSNNDAIQTSEFGGVISAGTFWVRFVSIIEVISK
ncbi:MAG: metallophosphoesterase family protein [Candidatus Thorarchaeota archaeon]